MLGPLCVGMVAFEIPDADPADGAPDLWDRLSDVVCRERKHARERIAVDDSKRLKGSSSAVRHPLHHLERGVLAFASSALPDDAIPDDDSALLAALGADVPEHRWYARPQALPVAHDRGILRIDASRLRRGLDDAGVRVAAMAVEVVDAGQLNEGVERAGTKAAVNLEAVLRHVDRIRDLPTAEGHPRVIVDRQGGRMRYRSDLARAWPEAAIEILVEHPDLSRYRLRDDRGALTISFLKEADAGHMPVALASMAAKYVRELFMLRLNGFFCGHVPELRPTAGYVQDGRRYVAEIQTTIETLGIPTDRLIRHR